MGNRVLRKDIYGPQKLPYLLREVGILVADTDRPVVLDPGHPAPVIVKADRGLQSAPGAGETERILPMHVGNIRQGSVFQQQFHFRDVVFRRGVIQDRIADIILLIGIYSVFQQKFDGFQTGEMPREQKTFLA